MRSGGEESALAPAFVHGHGAVFIDACSEETVREAL